METTFGNLLKLKRTAAGLKQSDIYKMTGIHASWISRIEREVKSWKDLRFSTVEKLAYALGCPVEELQKEQVSL